MITDEFLKLRKKCLLAELYFWLSIRQFLWHLKKTIFPLFYWSFILIYKQSSELKISTYYIALENEINFVKLQIVCLLYGLLCCTIRLEMDTGASLVLLYYRLSSPLLNRCLLPPVDMVWYQSSLYIAEFLIDIVLRKI